MAKKRNSPAIHVVLDTNCLYTDAAEHLLSLATKKTIQSTNDMQDIKVIWHLPTTVRAERKTQMHRKALQLLPNVKKMERLLGISLVADENFLIDRVETAIARQISELNVQEISLDHLKIEWKHIIECAELRVPPFEEQNEKGFRDALVIEALFQLAGSLPVSPASTRIVLVSSDGIVKEAVEKRINTRKNIRVISDFDELWTLINALHAEVSESTVNDNIDKARTIFYDKENESCIYTRENLYQMVIDKFPIQLIGSAAEGWKGKIKGLELGQTSFISKEGQRMLWASKLIFKTERSKSSIGGNISRNQPLSLLGQDIKYDFSANKPDKIGLFELISSNFSSIKNEIKENGRHIIECRWDVTLTTRGTLVGPKIQSLNHISSEWQQVDDIANQIASGTIPASQLNK